MSSSLDQLAAALADQYRLGRELGRGGMATVYLAEDLKHARQVAIKVLKPELAAVLGTERFLAEIKITARLDHPHILTLIDSGSAAGFLYYVLPLVRGESLRDRLRREPQLPLEDAVAITRQLAGALDYAHGQGVIHRDLKPENVLLFEGEAMLADFGIALAVREAGGARLTETGISLGTPQYMSPEQATGDRQLDARSDVYSLGTVAYEMLAGEPPLGGASAQAVIAKLMTTEPVSLGILRPSLPPAVHQAVARALAKVPADRWVSAGEFAAALAADGSGGRAAGREGGIAAGVPAFPPSRFPFSRALGLLAMAAIAVAAWLGWRHRTGATASAAERSIAVLPFENIGADTNDEYFSEGMSEELMTALGKVEGLRIAARTSSFSFQHRDVSAREIGDQLGVELILEGTVRRAGPRLRVSARLIKTGDGFELWSDEFERDTRDVFAVQDEITHAIVNALQVHLSPAQARLAQRPAVSPEAHDLYLQGRFFYEKRNEASLRRALQYFQQAIALDSSYAQAWAGLADTYGFLAGFGYERPLDVFPLAEAAVARALALDSTLVEAHTSLGYIRLWFDWDLPGAEREFQRALALDSTYSQAILFHSWYYVAAGRLDDAVREVARAHRVDPLSPIINTRIATMLHWQRKYPEALAQLAQVLEMDSTYALAHGQRLRTLVQMHRCEDAMAEFALPATWRTYFGSYDGAGAGYALAVCGRQKEARRMVDSLTVLSRTKFVPGEGVALAYVGLGEKDSAFAWLQRSLQDRVWSMFLIKVEPMLDGLRTDPRFAELERKVGLP